MKHKVDLNGRILDRQDASVPVTDLGLLYGIGLFETMRARRGTVPWLERHLDRLLSSAGKLGLPVTREMLPDAERVAALLRANGLSEARVRLTVTGGSPLEQGIRHAVLTTAATVEPYPESFYRDGITVAVHAQPQLTTDPLAGHKTLCYWPRLDALHCAQSRSCQEVLWFTENRQLAEGSISNVFVVRDNALHTPPLDTPALPGLARRAVLDLCPSLGLPCDERPLTIHDLLDAEEVFISNCMMEIVPVCRVEGTAIADERVGPVTRRISGAYREVAEQSA